MEPSGIELASVLALALTWPTSAAVALDGHRDGAIRPELASVLALGTDLANLGCCGS